MPNLKAKVKWSRYRPGVAQRVGRGIYSSRTAALEGGEWSAARPGHTLPPGKTRYPFYRRLGGPQGRSGRTENLVPSGIRSQTVQPVVSRYTDWATRPTISNLRNLFYEETLLKLGATTWIAGHKMTQMICATYSQQHLVTRRPAISEKMGFVPNITNSLPDDGKRTSRRTGAAGRSRGVLSLATRTSQLLPQKYVHRVAIRCHRPPVRPPVKSVITWLDTRPEDYKEQIHDESW